MLQLGLLDPMIPQLAPQRALFVLSGSVCPHPGLDENHRETDGGSDLLLLIKSLLQEPGPGVTSYRMK